MKKNLKLAYVVIVLSALFGGGINPFVKIGLVNVPPFTFSLFRFLLASIVIFPLLLRSGGKLKDVIKLMPFSLLGTMNIAFFVLGISYTTAISSQLLYLSVPISVSLLSFLFYRDKINFSKIIGIFIGIIGAILLIFHKQGSGLATGQSIKGNILILLATIFYSFYVMYAKKIQKKYTPVTITASFCLTTIAVMSALFIFEAYKNSNWWVHIGNSAVVSILYVGLLGTAAYYLLQQYAIKHGSPLISSMTLYIQPVFTVLWSNYLLGEVLTGRLLLSAALVFTGAWLVSR